LPFKIDPTADQIATQFLFGDQKFGRECICLIRLLRRSEISRVLGAPRWHHGMATPAGNKPSQAPLQRGLLFGPILRRAVNSGTSARSRGGRIVQLDID
jgi:hypothetical protein